MKEVILIMKYVIIEIMNVLEILFGGLDGFLCTLIFFVVMEYFTVGIVSILNKRLSEEFNFRGIARTISIFVLISMGHMIDMYVVQNESIIRTAIIFFYISKEGLSVLKNIETIGLPIPEKLKNILAYLRDNNK